MATEKTQEWQDASNGAAVNAGDGWNTVSEESQIVLESEGEGFTGMLIEMDSTNSGITQIHLTDVYGLNGEFLGDRMFINGTRDLVNKLKTVPRMREIRVEWTHSMNTGQATPMRVFSVQWR
jgi:hypothetical protein